MTVRESQRKYNATHIKRIPLDVQKEYYDSVLKPAADSVNESINGFIKTAISERIERLNNSVNNPED